MKSFSIAVMLASSACMVAHASPAQAQERSYDVPSGRLKAALEAFGRQSRRPIIFKADEVRGSRSPGFRGKASPEGAMAAILAGTGFSMIQGESGAIAIVRASGLQSSRSTGSIEDQENDEGAKPEILVTGARNWTLNTDIKRSRDDAQPYLIYDREQIRRSGSANVEDFFRDYVYASVSPATATQNSANNSVSGINLRGLGTDETLILVDGRRIAPLNNPVRGNLEQPPLNGIPLAAIDRIEVLGSSASGIYGANATGGVVNIILKRDYRGAEASGTFGGTYGGGARDLRLDLTAGLSLEGGRTNVSASGSWEKQSALFVGQREFLSRQRDQLLLQNPLYFSTLTAPPLGATTNIRSANGATLTLDPAYGGGSIGSNYTYVPVGYRGAATDGIAGLVGNAGKYNLDLAPTAGSTSLNGGSAYRLRSPVETWAGTVAIRREFTPWLRAFVEVSGSSEERRILTNRAPTSFLLAANAPSNPFQQQIRVTVPFVGADREDRYRNRAIQALGGLIIKLPYKWDTSIDYSWSRNWTTVLPAPTLDAATIAGLNSGSINVVRDLSIDPLQYNFLPIRSGSTDAASTATSLIVRFAGPVPFSLPGGQPTVTIQGLHNRNEIPDTRIVANAYNSSTIFFAPARAQTVDSIYGEARFPLFSSANHIPLFSALELQVAGRYERYRGEGAELNIRCLAVARPLEDADLAAPCPPAGTAVRSATSSRGSFNPTFSLKWTVVPDLVLRASYATGYRPPDLSLLVKLEGQVPLTGLDPQRGNEVIGTILSGRTSAINGFSGGNPDVRPERAYSYTAGAILSPRGIPSLRLSMDWTRIAKKDNYFTPVVLLLGTQQEFESFLKTAPERFVRGPASGGYAVGPITSIDASVINLVGSSFEAIDFAVDYSASLGTNKLDFSLAATWAYDMTVQTSLSAPPVQYAGVLTNAFSEGLGFEGGVEWKGNATVRYSGDNWSVGARARYFGPYYLNPLHSVIPAQGANHIEAQTYLDVFGTLKLTRTIAARAGISNFTNKKPPIDVGIFNGYSKISDSRLASYYLTLSKSF